MPYVITEPCIGVKDKSCVDVCPVDCIHGNDEDPQLYIDPQVCIDCAPVSRRAPWRRSMLTTTCRRNGKNTLRSTLRTFEKRPLR